MHIIVTRLPRLFLINFKQYSDDSLPALLKQEKPR